MSKVFKNIGFFFVVIIVSAGFYWLLFLDKQAKQDSVGTKPDYTFLLPDHHRVNMDVKFPLDNYLRYLDAENDTEKEKFKGQFLRDV